jgi:hypothetical protein
MRYVQGTSGHDLRANLHMSTCWMSLCPPVVTACAHPPGCELPGLWAVNGSNPGVAIIAGVLLLST